MRGVVVGGPRNFVLMHELAKATPRSPKELLVQVHACALTRSDLSRCLGLVESQTSLEYVIPGREFSGTVVTESDRFRQGQRVFGVLSPAFDQGAMAEFVLTDQDSIAIVPDSLDLSCAAAIPLAGISAVQACKQLQKDSSVLVLGADSWEGLIASFWVKLILGADLTIGIEGQDDEARYRKALGVLHCQVHRLGLSSALPKGFDLILDCIGGKEVWQQARDCLVSGGEFVTLFGDQS